MRPQGGFSTSTAEEKSMIEYYESREERGTDYCKGGSCPECEDGSFDEYEEDGPMDLEDQLECALDKAFPVREGEKHGD
jgi:hypothetical protein